MRDFHPLSAAAPRQTRLALVQSEAHVEPTHPADAVFTDFRVAPSVVVPASEPLEDTRRLMQLAGVRMAFVVEHDGAVTGYVTAADLQGERPLLLASHRGIAQVDLAVADVMTQAGDWATVDVALLDDARVGDIVATFLRSGQRYLVVTEPDAAGRPLVRGVFSANRVERALGRAIDVELRERSFAGLAAALSHG